MVEGSKEKVLVVDDDHQLQSRIEKLLTARGYHVFPSVTPEMALTVYSSMRPKLVISNVRFKETNAQDFILNLKKIDSDVAIVILSSPQDFELAQRVVSLGIYDLVALPFEADVFIKSIYRALEKKMLLERNRHLIEKQATLIENLHSSYQKLKEVDRLKSDFLINTSHELFTPITSMKALIHNLLKGICGELSPKQQEYITLIRENSDRLEELLKDILNYSQLESGQIKLLRKPLDLKVLIEKVVRRMTPIADKKNVTIRCSHEGSSEMTADSSRIEEILENLIQNAVKYNKKGGKIDLVSSINAAECILVVADNGLGISKEHYANLFNRFTQFHREDGPGKQGVGLGLSIVEKLVKLHGGIIAVESDVGHGSTFTVRLPIEVQSSNLGENE